MARIAAPSKPARTKKKEATPAPTLPESPAALLGKLARNAVADGIADIDAAAASVVNRLSAGGMVAPLVNYLAREAAACAIEEARYRYRASVTVNASRVTPESYADYAATCGIFDRWIVGGKRLGDCTSADLRDGAERERVTAQGHIQRAEQYERIAQLMGNRTGTVRAVLSETRVLRAIGEQ